VGVELKVKWKLIEIPYLMTVATHKTSSPLGSYDSACGHSLSRPTSSMSQKERENHRMSSDLDLNHTLKADLRAKDMEIVLKETIGTSGDVSVYICSLYVEAVHVSLNCTRTTPG
jgi:hypothetical protein